MTTDTSTTELDPLAEAAEGVAAPAYPVLAPDRIYRFKITKSELQPVNDYPDKRNLVITIKTEQDYTDKEGKPVRSGFAAFKYHTVDELPERKKGDKTLKAITFKDIKADLSVVLRAAGLKEKSARDVINNPAMLEGYIVDMKASIKKESGGYPEGNNFKYIEPQ